MRYALCEVAYILYIWFTYAIGFRIITSDDVFGESSGRWEKILVSYQLVFPEQMVFP